MNDPLIRMQGVELYAQLKSYRFIPEKRIYNCEAVTLVDTLTGKSTNVSVLPVSVEVDGFDSDSVRDGNWLAITTLPAKITNKKERHEIIGGRAIMSLEGRRYHIDDFFMRAELQKRVPERTRLPLLFC